MANKPIQMSKLRQVLRLYCQGDSKLHISTFTGLSRNTVSKYVDAFIGLKTTWEEASRLSDTDLDELFCKAPVIVPPERLEDLHKYFKEGEKRLLKRGVTYKHLWEEYHQQHPEGYGRTQFYLYYCAWKRRSKPSMHMEHKAGDKMYVDFAGEKLPFVDTDTGEIRQAEVFMAILGASQLMYVEAVDSQKVEDFISACENSLHYYGGAPTAIVPDNLKSAVIKASRYEPRLNENFEAFADHYGMSVLPARPYKPKDKALVEGAVKISYSSIYAALPSEPAHSLEALNAQIWTLLEQKNNAAFKGSNYSRRQRFEEMEKVLLQPLPEKRFELRCCKFITVMLNGHVSLHVDKHYYSVPYSFIGKKVKMLYSKSIIEVFYKYERIATHKRVRSPHNYTTDPAHMASQHQFLAERNPEYYLSQARAIHPDVEFFISQVLFRKQHVEQSYKSCSGILAFAKRIGHHRLTKACQRAHSYGLYHFKAIENILQKGLDQFDIEQEQQLTMPLHENIRGEDYYQ
jgi:transposase